MTHTHSLSHWAGKHAPSTEIDSRRCSWLAMCVYVCVRVCACVRVCVCACVCTDI